MTSTPSGPPAYALIDEIFQRYFAALGSGVRPEQRAVIESLLAGNNTLSLMPTGGGKSLCYWIAGVALGGTTIVVSPLTALMDEQADKLRSHKLAVAVLHSGVRSQSQFNDLVSLAQGTLPNFVLVSPERLATDGFLEYVLRQQRDKIKLVVIDEIHCISQWGPDFRPFYAEIPRFLDNVFKHVQDWPRILGLTATLNQKDTEQICRDFHINPTYVHKSRYLLRYAIQLNVVKVPDEPEKDLLFWPELARHRDEKVLVYVDNRRSGDRSTEEMSRRAKAEGFSSAFFHGSMSSEQKSDVIRRFKAGAIRTVFATSAFGMGIDIPDIRGVIHYRPPESVEQYYQQIGRAGRDGQMAWSLLYYSDKNISFRKSYFIDRSFPDANEIRDAFANLVSARGNIKTFNYFDEQEAQTAYHYLLHSAVLSLRCKGIQSIDVLSKAASVSLPRFDEYQRATRTGIAVRVADQCHISIEALMQDIYGWLATRQIKPARAPQKSLFLEQVVDQLPDSMIESILADAAEKKQYRYGLLDDLTALLEGFTDSATLHQQIGSYLGVGTDQGDATPTAAQSIDSQRSQPYQVRVLTEGPTDWKHLKAGLTRLQQGGMFVNLQVEFQENEQDMGDKELLNTCRGLSRVPHSVTTICIFDRDVSSTLQHVIEVPKDYKSWGNLVYSVALPIPDHRRETPDICIEFYYRNEEIQRKDSYGRRLFIGTEFRSRSLAHVEEMLICADRNKAGKFTIVDSQVFPRDSEENVALSKNAFAQHVLDRTPGFDDFDLSAFVAVFELFERIVQAQIGSSARDVST